LKKRQPELIRDRACDRPRRAVWMGPHKLIYQDHPIQMHSGIELYDVDNDPQESVNLRDILPENVEVLQDCLAAFCEENPSGVNAILGETRAIGFDDPEVQDRLRDLGYLED
ncbi:MAG: sulfatase, partial [Prochlorotrichaceae cyanobacterium]